MVISIIRLFQNTSTLDELLPVVSKYVSEKRERKASTLHAFLYKMITEIIQQQNTYELESSLIWETVEDKLDGSPITSKPQAFESVEYGTISHKDITVTLIEVFGATRPKRHGESRKLIFHSSKLEKLAMVYNLDVKIEVKVGGTLGSLGTLMGLDRHLREQSADEKSAQSIEEKSDSVTSTVENREEYLPEGIEGDPGLSVG